MQEGGGGGGGGGGVEEVVFPTSPAHATDQIYLCILIADAHSNQGQPLGSKR